MHVVLYIAVAMLFFRTVGYSMSNTFDPGTVGHMEKALGSCISITGAMIVLGLAIIAEQLKGPK